MDSTTLFMGLIFGSLGMGYFVYGKKQKKLVAFASGIGLFVIPYVGTNALFQGVIGVLLMALPFVIKY